MSCRNIPAVLNVAGAAGTSSTTATLSWTAQDGGSAITSYASSCVPTASPATPAIVQTFNTSICTGTGSNLSCTTGPGGVTGLQAGVAYTCSVTATNAKGKSVPVAAPSFTTSALPPPSPPPPAQGPQA
jgi:hypothetical protein